MVISMLITIERRASCLMFARSCKHPIKMQSANCGPADSVGTQRTGEVCDESRVIYVA